MDKVNVVDENGFPQVKYMIDTHVHLYDTSRPEGVPWPEKDDPVLYKPHLPDEFKQASGPAGLTATVIVEASEWLPDNRWVVDLVQDDPYFVAFVGNIDPYREDFAEQLSALKQDQRLVGLRARNPEPIDYTNPMVLQNYKTLAENQLSLDFLANGEGIAGIRQADQLARSIPELTIIFDHVLGYNIDGTQPESDWLAAANSLAENRNVYCKVSGLYQRSVRQPAPSDDEYYKPILDVLWNIFGQERLVFGSNWPCTKHSNDYASFVRIVTRYFSKKGQAACEHYFWKNANVAYRLGLQ